MMNRRRKQGEDHETFSPWEAYSDLYCGLLLVFVLLFFFSIYQLISAREVNNADTQTLQATLKAEQQAAIAIYRADMEDQEAALAEKTEKVNSQQAALAIALADLEDREAELDENTRLLVQRETEINALSETLNLQQTQLDDQSARLAEQESLLAEKETQLSDQETLLAEKETQLAEQDALLAEKETQLADQETRLAEQDALLAEKETQLTEQETRLTEQDALLAEKETQLVSQETTIQTQQALLDDQAARLEAVVGVRGQLIEALNDQLRANDIQLQADQTTGAIVFDSSLLFGVNSTKLSAEGAAFVRTFLPIYMDVLLQEEFREYIAEIIIEGHTDSSGSYMYNLELSQQRALSVAEYCINGENDFLTPETAEALRQMISINGCSYRSPVYNGDGTINEEKSRRVEIKFRLTDQEMIRTLEGILNQEDN